MYAKDTPNNHNDVDGNLYLVGCSSLDVKKACIK